MYHFLFFLSVFSKDVFYRNFQEIEFYWRKVSLAPMRGFQLKILASIGKYSWYAKVFSRPLCYLMLTLLKEIWEKNRTYPYQTRGGGVCPSIYKKSFYFLARVMGLCWRRPQLGNRLCWPSAWTQERTKYTTTGEESRGDCGTWYKESHI